MGTGVVEGIVAAVRGTLREGSFALHEPRFAGNEWVYVKECIDTGWVSSAGKYVDRFEQDIARVTGAAHAIATVNGTTALQVAMLVCGAEPGDEVIVPALSFIATANAVSHCHAVPHFVDCDEATLGMSVPALERHLSAIASRSPKGWTNKATGRRLAAIVPMHTFGHPVDMPALIELAARYSLPVIEDAAESLGTYLDGRHTGTFGICGTLSFNGNKVVTTGGGGAVITDDAALAKRLKHITTTAKLPHRWAFFHDEVGFNFRMPNLNAALGCAQLEQLDGFVESKRRLHLLYKRAFDSLEGASLYSERKGVRSNYWLQAILLDEECAAQRDAVLEALNGEGYMSRPVWELLPHLPMYRDAPRSGIPVAESLARRIVNIPSSAGLARG